MSIELLTVLLFLSIIAAFARQTFIAKRPKITKECRGENGAQDHDYKGGGNDYASRQGQP